MREIRKRTSSVTAPLRLRRYTPNPSAAVTTADETAQTMSGVSATLDMMNVNKRVAMADKAAPPQPSRRTPRNELTQVIGEMAAQQIGDEVTGSWEGWARRRKRVDDRKRRRIRLLSG